MKLVKQLGFKNNQINANKNQSRSRSNSQKLPKSTRPTKHYQNQTSDSCLKNNNILQKQELTNIAKTCKNNNSFLPTVPSSNWSPPFLPTSEAPELLGRSRWLALCRPGAPGSPLPAWAEWRLFAQEPSDSKQRIADWQWLATSY